MLRDLEGHEVQIVGENNNHRFLYGVSGLGKTYENVREVEEYLRMRKNVLIIDFSGSYTSKELRAKGFLYPNRINRFMPYKEGMRWIFQTKDKGLIIKDMTDALCEVLECSSYYQRKLLLEAIARTVARKEFIRLPDIVRVLEEMLEEENAKEKTTGNSENLQHLMTRLFPYEEILDFEFGNKISQVHAGIFVTIIDLSGYAEGQRRFLTKLLVSLLWREVYRQENRKKYDVLLLDEMQFLPLKEGSTLSSMLREGRKKELDLVLSTQYVGHYSRSELRALQQADTMLVFRPVPEDLKRAAK